MNNREKEIIEYYKNHSSKQTSEKFDISPYLLRKLLDNSSVPHHTPKENAQFNGNGFAKHRDKIFSAFIESLDIDDFYNYYLNNAKYATATKYSISVEMVNKILDHFQLKRLSAIEAKKCVYTLKYGDYETGSKIESDKRKSSIDYEKAVQKRFITNAEKYGGKSPFCSEEVRNKSKETVLRKYGVDNVRKSDVVKNKIKQTQSHRYGGVGFASESLMNKYKQAMLDKYGVKYGCLLPQCYESRNGKFSVPNNAFEKTLVENNINHTTEFILDTFRYDFKIDNVLVEINPSYSHNSTFGYKGYSSGIDKNYHCEKSKKAVENGYKCISVWDWDDVDKVVNLLKHRDVVYARKCSIKLIDNNLTKTFLNQHHLQGYVKSDINLGLFYNDELVSVMTFGRPRYNKKYQYELLRYCSIKNVVGGVEKLFKYFLKTYNPTSIISYCDLSKFTGDVYDKLGFERISLSIGKHWYNIKTGKHITDNLLRQRGFDQLLGDQYGRFGKGTSNEELMLKYGFVEIYDCGQASYIFHI